VTGFRKHAERRYTVAEAAAILEQPQKRISNALERELRPLGLGSLDRDERTISSRGLVALELLRDFASWFTPQFRKAVIMEALRASSIDTISVQKGRVMVSIAEQRQRVNKAKDRLREAEALVVRDPEILGGEPCVKGTRIPAYLVGALARKHGIAEVHTTYPSLSRQMIELVALYVEANPRKGRPRQAELSAPKGAKRGKAKKVRLDRGSHPTPSIRAAD